MNKQSVKKVIQFVDDLYLSANLGLFEEKPAIRALLFHTVFSNICEIEKDLILPQQRLTLDDYRLIFEYFLEHNYQFLSFSDLQHDLDWTKKYIYVTFDDGYFNNLTIMPLVEELNIPIHVFVTTENVLQNHRFWWDIVYQARKAQNVSNSVIKKEIASLKTKPPSAITNYVTSKFGKDALLPNSDVDRPLSVEELRKFSKHELVSIGNHTHSHTIVSSKSRTEYMDEIKLSQKNLHQITGTAPSSFAFPNGDYDKSLFKCLMDEGFRLAFGSEEKMISENSLHSPGEQYRLGRYCISGGLDLLWQARICRVGKSPYLVAKNTGLL